MSGEKITVTVELTDEQAQALAQYLKRYIWTDVRQSAASDEERSESTRLNSSH